MFDSLGSRHNTPLPLDLLALSDLRPPSPVLSPTELTATWTWSDIQIELNLTVESDEEQTPVEPVDSTCSVNEVALSASASTSTVSTTGTFGPSFRRHRTGLPSSSEMCTGSTLERSEYLSTLEEVVHIYPSVSAANGSKFMSAAPRGPKRALDRVNGTTTDVQALPPSSSGNYGTSISPRLGGNTLSPHVLSIRQTGSAGSQPQDSSNNDGNIATSLRIFLSPDIRVPLSYDSSFLPPSDSCPMLSRKKTTRTKIEDPPNNVYARRLALAATLATLEKKMCYSEPSTPNLSASTPGLNSGMTMNLRETTVELLIDQEGFRSVLAGFKYSGSSTGDGGCVAHFKPTKRQMFNFHFASLEALPVLRRITVNGEESRDYISRQASLGLKSNGVYSVQGYEILAFPAPGQLSTNPKLQWKFEYLVDDRRPDLPGKLVSNGEKVLTPLSFSCSPLLLHPLQGKRVRLMHIMKKSVIPKLLAEKMEPPNFAPKIEPQSNSVLQTPVPSYATHPRRGLNPYKRTAAILIPCSSEIDAVSPSLIRICDQDNAPPRRRRRASSAGERSQSSSSPPYTLPPVRPPLFQNIIHPSCIAALIDSGVSDRERC